MLQMQGVLKLTWSSLWYEPGACMVHTSFEVTPRHTPDQEGYHLWKGAFSFLQEAGEIKEQEAGVKKTVFAC